MVDPISVSAAVAYAGKVGPTKVASWVIAAATRRGWALRAAWKAFRRVSRPRPVRATAKWIKRPETLADVLFQPDKPGASAIAALDQHLCSASKRWRAVLSPERKRRLDVVLGEIYNLALTEHDPRWTTMISGERVLEMSRRTQQEVAELRHAAEAAIRQGTEDQIRERLPLIPAQYRDSVLARWRDAKEDTWRVLSLITSAETQPAALMRAWEDAPPAWLLDSALPARLVAADLAWAYTAPRLAARLYLSAARDGAPRPQQWAARAAFILYQLDDHKAAAAVINEFASLPTEAFYEAVAAILRGDWAHLRKVLTEWSPSSPSERLLRFFLFQREVLLGRGNDVIPRAELDEVINAGTRELSAGWLGGVALIVARMLVLRAKRSEADQPYKDLRTAMDLALRVRNDRRAVRASSADAVAQACDAALAAKDLKAVIRLGDANEGEATAEEAGDPAVRELVALARTIRGDKATLVRESDATSPFAAARLRAAQAQSAGEDPLPSLREALTAATDDSDRITALAALARAGADELPGLDEIAVRYPAQGQEIRALADLAQGREGAAIAALRNLATTSLTAALALAGAYSQVGDAAAEVETLRAAAQTFHDPQLRLEAVWALIRSGDRAAARTELVRCWTRRLPTGRTWPMLSGSRRS